MRSLASKIMLGSNRKTCLYYVGQAGYIIKSENGTLLGIDLYLSNCVERVEGHVGFKRLQPAPIAADDIIFDYLVATHPHYDHFDVDSMPIFLSNGHTKLFASINCKKEVDRLLIPRTNINYVQQGDRFLIDDIQIEFVFCDHGIGAPDAVGVIVIVDGKRLYFAGDTCLRMDKVDELNELGPFDLMIAPINGAYGNLSEYDCAELSNALKPALTIPSHYGMFASHGGDPGAFIKHMKAIAPKQKYLLMAVCEMYIL